MKDPVQQWLLKAMRFLFVTALALSLIGEALRNITTTQWIVIGAIVSIIAYFIRRRRMSPTRRPPTTATGERTPIMPRTDS